MGIIQWSVAEHASQSQWALMAGPGISVTWLWSEDLTVGGVKFQQSCLGNVAAVQRGAQTLPEPETLTRKPRKPVRRALATRAPAHTGGRPLSVSE